MNPREPCCVEKKKHPCGTRWEALRVWSAKITGKGIRVVALEGTEQGKTPFFAQPVGFDGRTIFLAWDYGCDTEKLLHEVCHWLLAPRERRGRVNYGMGPAQQKLDDVIADNEEVSVMLLEQLLAPHFHLMPDKIAKPDYNVASKRNVDWAACEERAAAAYAAQLPGLPKT